MNEIKRYRVSKHDLFDVFSEELEDTHKSYTVVKYNDIKDIEVENKKLKEGIAKLEDIIKQMHQAFLPKPPKGEKND